MCFKIRGGVPVFNLPVVNPRRLKLSVKPNTPDSPKRPQGASYSPIKILPPKKVPVVRTAARQGIILPRSVTTPIIFCLIPLRQACVAKAYEEPERFSPGIEPDSKEPELSFGNGTSEATVKTSTTVSINAERFSVVSTTWRARDE